MPNVLVTGASRGIGLEFTRSFAADGWRVHACARQREKAKALKKVAKADIEGDVVRHRLDVRDSLQMAALARTLRDEAIDVLINNAGVGGPKEDGFQNTDYEAWAEVFAVNTMAPLRVAEHFVEHIAASEKKLLVNISSRLGSIAENSDGGRYIYRSSKTALNMVAKSLSVDLAPRGITVVVFHPGWVKTDMGGQDAPLTTAESVSGMRQVIAGLSQDDSGKFFNFDGHEIRW